MAPINPYEILEAFSPLLTDTGGIKKVDESQYLNLLKMMKTCSTKLVSRCIFCQILLSTSTDILEEFLKIGVWDLIAIWVKTSKDDGSVSYLLELLKLLHTLPMNIDRLRENECPKIVKKLCKHDNEEIAQKANQIIKKWTKIITGSSVPGNLKDKKRKADNNSSTNESSKKTKSSSSKSESSNGNNDSSESVNVLNDADQYETFSRDDMSKFMVDTTKESKPRPVTVKVKQGKFRLDLSAPSSSAESKIKKKSTEIKENKASELTKLSSRKLSTGGDALKVPDRSKKSSLIPTPPTTPIIKDSVSFMDALSVMPVLNRKRRKLNKDESSTTNKVSNSQEVKVEESNSNNSMPSALLPPFGSTNHDTSTSGSLTAAPGSGSQILPKVKSDLDHPESSNAVEVLKSPPRFSFYKDILEETKSEEETATSQSKVQTEDNVRTGLDDNSETPQSPDKTCTDDASRATAAAPEMRFAEDATVTKLKPILNYVKKGSKKSVRWPEDDTDLEKVKYFELDETERINVTRPQAADMKRFDMKHEAQFMSEAKKRSVSYAPWKLIPIYLDPENVPVVKGYNSKEREIQAEAMKTTLECFYIQNQIPDSAREPDPEFFTESSEQPKIIPLEDENMKESKVQDYSSINTSQPALSAEMPNNYEYGSTNVPYNPTTDPFQAMPNNTNQFPPATSQYPGPPNMPANYTSPPSTFDSPTSNNFSSYNNSNYSNVPSNPPIYNPTPYAQSEPFNSNFGAPPMNNVQNSVPNAMNQSSPNMFNPSQAPNYYNNNQGPPPPMHPPANDPAYNNSFWPESNNNFNANPGGQFNMPPPHPGPGGPRFRGHRGRGGRGGFHPKGNNDGVCRFFLKNGHCKFGARCNYSHVVDNSKPVRF